VVNHIAATSPLAMVHSGDFVRTGDQADQWAEEMRGWSR